MPQPQRLPEPRAELWEWQQLGHCRDFGPAMFFGGEDEDRRSCLRRIARAKQICGACPVLSTCRDHALSCAEQHGVWGGLTAGERAAILAADRPGDRDDASSSNNLANKIFR
jgi:WhiB family redox-sensing transcriptional regulator